MTRNKVRVFSCLATLVVLLAACSKSYLQTDPTDRVPTSEALTTTTGCWDLLNGVHRILYSTQLGRQDMVGQGTNMMYMDLMGEDMPIYSLDDWFVAPYLWYQSSRSPTSATVYFNYFF